MPPSRRLRLFGAVLLALAGLWRPASSQPGDAPPVLRVETGAHSGWVSDAATDAAGRVLVTVSPDKTARVWSLPDLRPLGVLRVPIGPDEEGRLYAVAVSPDGRLAAVGGWLGRTGARDVLLFDLATRRVVRRLGGPPGSTHSLAFSPDGARLAAGTYNGVWTWKVVDGVSLAQDRDYQERVSGLAFAPNGQLAAASFDGGVRLYDAAGRRLRRVATEAGRRPARIRFSPDGRRLALGFQDALAVEVREGDSLALVAKPDVAGLSGQALPVVGWSADGRTLYAGGEPSLEGGRPVLAWDEAGRGPRRIAAAGFKQGPTAVVPLADGGLAYASGAGDVAVAGSDGRRRAERRPAGSDLRLGSFTGPSAWRFRLSRDGRAVEWASWDTPDRWLRFDAGRPDLAAGETPRPGFVDWSADAAGLRVTDWAGREDPKLNGAPFGGLGPTERAQSAAVAPGRVLLGSGLYLRLFDGEARLLCRPPPPATVWRVNQSPDGRVAAAALGDGTIRWYRLHDGAEVLALFVTADARRWVAWTPSGYYAAGPGGEDLIGWHVDNGPDRAADFFSASRFRERYYRPDVVALAVEAPDEAEALRRADAARGTTKPAPPPLTHDLPPVLNILGPADGARLTGAVATIDYGVRSPSGRPVRAVRVLLDGRPVQDTRGLERLPQPPEAAPDAEARGRVRVPIPPGREVEVALLAETDTRVGEPARLRLRGMPAPTDPLLPRLNAVLVGVSDYVEPDIRLTFAAKDARDLAGALEAQRGRGLYREVNLRVLTDREATRAGVLDALEWLRRETTANDVAVVYLAGHGVVARGRTAFLPADADVRRLTATTVGQADLQDTLASVAGRVVAFVDICHAGASVLAQNRRGVPAVGGVPGGEVLPDMTAFVNQLREPDSGLIVFAASTSREPAVEVPERGNGAFTAALLEGLRGGADLNRDGVVRTDELNVFVADRVRALTDGRQHPVMQRPNDVPDFPFAAVQR